MVSNCFKVILYAGFALAFVNFVANVVALFVWDSDVGDYQSRGESIISFIDSDETSNSEANSTWFSALSDEYDNLSDFDKEYVYCDIVGIRTDPSEHYGEGVGIWLLACIFSFAAVFAFAILSCALFYTTQHASFDTPYEIDVLTGTGDIQRKTQNALRNPPKPDKAKENAWTFKAMTAVLFCETGPFLALVWLMIIRTGQLTGLECQEMFYSCGKSGDCNMDKLMAPVALNSSVLKIAISDPFFATAFFAGVLTLMFVFFSGLCLFIRSCDLNFILLPVFQLIFALLPFTWVYYLEEKVAAIGAIEGIMILAHVPLLVMVGAIAVDCCRSRKK